MKLRLLILFILSLRFGFTQEIRDVFKSKRWEETLKKKVDSPIIFSIHNSFDNWDGANNRVKPFVLYFLDSTNHWNFQIILVDIKKQKWTVFESIQVILSFDDYINNNIEAIKTEFEDLYEESTMYYMSTRNMQLFYRDSNDIVKTEYYSSSFGVNEIMLSHPHVFNLYSFAMNMSFNIKLKRKHQKKLY